jgi:hypothetical protein
MRGVPIESIFDWADDLPGFLAETVRQLPGFEPYSPGWEEPDLDTRPEWGAVFAGAVDDVELTVAKLRRGGQMQLIIAIETVGPVWLADQAKSSVSWFYPARLKGYDEGGVANFPLHFRAEGHLLQLLDHQQFLSVIRQLDGSLNGMLFNDPRQFMAKPISSVRSMEDELPVIEEQETGASFLARFVYRVSLAESLSGE